MYFSMLIFFLSKDKKGLKIGRYFIYIAFINMELGDYDNVV